MVLASSGKKTASEVLCCPLQGSVSTARDMSKIKILIKIKKDYYLVLSTLFMIEDNI